MDSALFAFAMHVVVVTSAGYALRFIFGMVSRPRTNLALAAGCGLAIAVLHEVLYLGSHELPSAFDAAMRVLEVLIAFALLCLL